MDKIKSLVGKVVRIKREYIKTTNTLYSPRWTEDGYCNQVYLEGTPFDDLFKQCDYDDCHDGNPLKWLGIVHSHLFGINVIHDKNISDYKPTHIIVLKDIGIGAKLPLSWDLKYFEVVIAKEVVTTEWVVDEQFNNI
jgi:hypothetical protein